MDINNYRPISIYALHLKLLKRPWHLQFESIWKITNSFQLTNLDSIGTGTLLWPSTNEWRNSIYHHCDNSMVAQGVFLDFSSI